MAFRRLRHVTIVAALMTLTVTSAGCQVPRDTVDVLFLGNSYIYFNNLPEMVLGISTALDGPIVRGAAHTHGGKTLRGHVDDDHLPSILSEGPEDGGDWDWVVLQEQSTLGAAYDRDSGALGSPDAFHAATRELATMIRGGGASPALYMTWAKEAFPSQSETLSQAYRSIGTELGLEVARVGEAWAEVRRLRPDFSLYVDDGSHPNAAGSYLAACVIYAMVTGRSPLDAPRELTGAPWDFGGPVESSLATILVSLSAEDARFLQGIAAGFVVARAGAGAK
jgi:hypothetical protein